MERSSRHLFEVLSRNFPGTNEEYHDKSYAGCLVYRAQGSLFLVLCMEKEFEGEMSCVNGITHSQSHLWLVSWISVSI